MLASLGPLGRSTLTSRHHIYTMARSATTVVASPAASLRRSTRKRPAGSPQPLASPKKEKKQRRERLEHDKPVKREPAADEEEPLESSTTAVAQKGHGEVNQEASPTRRLEASPPASLDSTLAARKLKLYYGADSTSTTAASPFPDFPRPTAAECKVAHRALAALHGPRERPSVPPTAGPSGRAGCGDAPTVLDALVRTILSQNTTDANSSRAKRAMDAAYGGHDNWAAVAAGGAGRLEEAIRCGGLAAAKSRVIVSILDRLAAAAAAAAPVDGKAETDGDDKAVGGDGGNGRYSLEYVRALPTADAMRELLSFRGVGPKTASCVLLFCLGRDSFAVDTHVHRIAGILGWRPARATRDETHLHLDARVPDEDKYGLHVLMVTHGKRCAECRAGGRAAGRCALRRAVGRARGGEA